MKVHFANLLGVINFNRQQTEQSEVLILTLIGLKIVCLSVCKAPTRLSTVKQFGMKVFVQKAEPWPNQTCARMFVIPVSFKI